MTDYDFIEIGTSDFNTLIRRASNTCKGLSVEPLKCYLDRLPNKSQVKKVCAAVSNCCGEIEIYYIPDDIRVTNGLPEWMKGTNSIGHPHPQVLRYLKKHGLPEELIQNQTVQVLSVQQLFDQYEVKSLGTLKVDTEGHDPIIMMAYCDLIECRPELKAKSIKFESNSLSSKLDVKVICERLERNGYRVHSTQSDTIGTLIVKAS